MIKLARCRLRMNQKKERCKMDQVFTLLCDDRGARLGERAYLAVQVRKPVEPASMVVCASSRVIAFSSEAIVEGAA